MSRPCKIRKVCCRLGSEYFKPRGVPLQSLGEVCLTLDELESIRLADFNESYQEKAASKMKISRQTFGNIIKSAHKKIAKALLQGKALKIEGGFVKRMER